MTPEQIAAVEREARAWLETDHDFVFNRHVPISCSRCGKEQRFHTGRKIRRLLDALAAQREENAQWRAWGIVEIAVRNTNVASYCKEWEARAEAAEAAHAKLDALRREVWENPEQWMKWCDVRVLERAEAAEAEVARLRCLVEPIHDARNQDWD